MNCVDQVKQALQAARLVGGGAGVGEVDESLFAALADVIRAHPMGNGTRYEALESLIRLARSHPAAQAEYERLQAERENLVPDNLKEYGWFTGGYGHLILRHRSNPPPLTRCSCRPGPPQKGRSPCSPA